MLTQEVATVRKTALYDEHVARGARIVEFAGWAMPMQFAGIVQEHRRVRSTAGIFDVSHMGEFIVSGADALQALERLTTNRLSTVAEGRVQYSAMCYENGGFIDDLLIYAMPGRYMLVVNAANKEKDLEWIRSNITGDVRVDDVSDETGLIALQGPSSDGIMTALTTTDLEALRYYAWVAAKVAGHDVTLSRTGYTGEDGFEIYCDPEDAPVHLERASGGGDVGRHRARGTGRQGHAAARDGLQPLRQRDGPEPDAGRGRAHVDHKALER